MRAVLVGLFVLCSVWAEDILFLGLNEKCRNETEPWLCKRSITCKALKKAMIEGKLKVCSFCSKDPIVCCPPETSTSVDSSQTVTESIVTVTESIVTVTGDGNEPPATTSNANELPVTVKGNETEQSVTVKSNETEQSVTVKSNETEQSVTVKSNGTEQSVTFGRIATEQPVTITTTPRYGQKAEEKCREYAQYVFNIIQSPIPLAGSKPRKLDECAISVEALIVGGTPAKLKEFPHMALIGVKKELTIVWHCGGSLISPRFILSAAHCNVSQDVPGGKAVARLGDLDIRDDYDRAKPINVKIVQVFDHPEYSHDRPYHDISLFKLERDLVLSPQIRPLCLHTSPNITREKLVAAGWGYTSFGGYPSDILQKVILPINSHEKCQSSYAFEREKLPKGIVQEIMFCAGGTEDKDTCLGDSGGPLQVAVKDPYCMYVQVGITSFGVGCGSSVPSGYTRVSHYIPWIESIVWP